MTPCWLFVIPPLLTNVHGSAPFCTQQRLNMRFCQPTSKTITVCFPSLFFVSVCPVCWTWETLGTSWQIMLHAWHVQLVSQSTERQSSALTRSQRHGAWNVKTNIDVLSEIVIDFTGGAVIVSASCGWRASTHPRSVFTASSPTPHPSLSSDEGSHGCQNIDYPVKKIFTAAANLLNEGWRSPLTHNDAV